MVHELEGGECCSCPLAGRAVRVAVARVLKQNKTQDLYGLARCLDKLLFRFPLGCSPVR
jgi:hypothetical protein